MAWMFIYFIFMCFNDRVIGSIDDTLVLARNESSQPIRDSAGRLLRNHEVGTALSRDGVRENSASIYLQGASITQVRKFSTHLS